MFTYTFSHDLLDGGTALSNLVKEIMDLLELLRV